MDPERFDEFFRASVRERPIRLGVAARCGTHGERMTPAVGEMFGEVAEDSVRVACPEAGCDVSVVLTLRASAPQEDRG